MNLFPLLEQLRQCKRTLIVGAGGGYDVFCGLPIYFWLQSRGHEVGLANLTFSPLQRLDGPWYGGGLVLDVDSETVSCGNYFPEKYLCEFLEQVGVRANVHTILRGGVPQITAAYQEIVDVHHYDSVLLVDGGTDALMRGDEAGLGTPQEDIASIYAANQLSLDHVFLVCLGFGVDSFHGVNHFQFLHAVADLSRAGGFLGTISLLEEWPEVEKYRQACQFVFQQMPHHPSIVNASILDAIAGKYGDVHATRRTEGSKLWINPLMAMYWAFELKSVADRCLYLDRIGEAQTMMDLTIRIEAFRHEIQTRAWEDIPV